MPAEYAPCCRPVAARESPLAGVLGTVASLIQVPPDLEKAIETALGGAYQNVVTRTWADTQAAIEFLKRTGNGRATFLPLDRLYRSITPPRATTERHTRQRCRVWFATTLPLPTPCSNCSIGSGLPTDLDSCPSRPRYTHRRRTTNRRDRGGRHCATGRRRQRGR